MEQEKILVVLPVKEEHKERIRNAAPDAKDNLLPGSRGDKRTGAGCKYYYRKCETGILKRFSESALDTVK